MWTAVTKWGYLSNIEATELIFHLELIIYIWDNTWPCLVRMGVHPQNNTLTSQKEKDHIIQCDQRNGPSREGVFWFLCYCWGNFLVSVFKQFSWELRLSKWTPSSWRHRWDDHMWHVSLKPHWAPQHGIITNSLLKGESEEVKSETQ